MKRIAIIGNGIAGVTLARNLRKRDPNSEIVIIGDETKYFFSRTALMYVFMGHMKFGHTKPYEDWFWKKNNLDLKFGRVTQVDFDDKKLYFKDGSDLKYTHLVLALGSKPRYFGWKGQDLKGVSGLYSCQDLMKWEEIAKTAKKVVIVGGGLIGTELLEMLHSRSIEVLMIVKEESLMRHVFSKEESLMLDRHLREYGVQFRTGVYMNRIEGNDQGEVRAAVTSREEEIECDAVGITTGVEPNIDLVRNTKLNMDWGILVNQQFETNIEGVYAIGDCAQFEKPIPGRRAVEQMWYTGKIMGETLALTLSGKPSKYNPGPWFNSAKFFDIEYQTYGLVPAEDSEEVTSFTWKGKDCKKMLRFAWDSKTGKFIGVNAFGVRLRHELLDRWLSDERDIEFVLLHLNDVWFDPELYKNPMAEVVELYNENTGKDIKLKRKSWARILNPLGV